MTGAATEPSPPVGGVRPLTVLVGPPGAGKSTIGRKLARSLEVDFEDTDQLVEASAGRPIPEIFAADGEPAFRALEEQVVARALRESTGVLALGGGAVLSARTRSALRGHAVVHLSIGVAEGVRRSSGTGRPLLAGGDITARYQRLVTERSPLYREVAWLTVSTERRSTGKVVREIAEALGRPLAPTYDDPTPTEETP